MNTEPQTASEAEKPAESDKPITTAEEYIADALDRAQKCLESMFKPGSKEIDHVAIATYLGYFPAVVFLEALRRRDPAEADKLAAFVDEALEAGDTASELVWQWTDQIKRGHPMTMVGPGPDEQPNGPTDLQTIPMPFGGEAGTVEVPSVPSTCPGLVIAQGIKLAGAEHVPLAGFWRIAHEPSGLALGRATYPLTVAQAIAHQLGQLDIDWEQPEPDHFRHLGTDIGKAVAEVFADHAGCAYCSDADHLPVLPFRKVATDG